MTDGLLLVNFGSLQQASDYIEKALQKLRGDLDRLDQMARPLVETWDGAAKLAYEQRQKTWTGAANDLEVILRQIQGAVGASRDDYLATERAATQRFE